MQSQLRILYKNKSKIIYEIDFLGAHRKEGRS